MEDENKVGQTLLELKLCFRRSVSSKAISLAVMTIDEKS